ncbi:ankyrin repeat-containing protein bda1 [Quercus suber]|uniref:Ankyrin repeat-containing protein bda1 n=1 Tax=Quercus suber TaxID=58331 RepID=A0AAW0IRM4_QUESU
MDEWMKQVAESGDVNAVYLLIEKDVKLLEHIDQLPFVQTPLHIAASAGNIQFAMEMIDVTRRNEMVLHIALKYNRLGAFKFFVKQLGLNVYKNAELHQRFVLNKKDNEGNTVLHIAVSKNQTEAVRQLLAWGYKFVYVNQKNLEGKTAWDILQGQTQVDNSEMRVMLRDAKAKPASSLSTFNSHPNNQRPPYFSRHFVWALTSINREMRNLTEERRNILLMVAVLLATLSFQVVLTPPGGLWQDNGQCINLTEVPGSSHHNGSNHLTPFNITTFFDFYFLKRINGSPRSKWENEVSVLRTPCHPLR